MLLPVGFTCYKDVYTVLFKYDDKKYQMYYDKVKQRHPNQSCDDGVDFYYQVLHCHPNDTLRKNISNYHHNAMRAMYHRITYIRDCQHWSQRSSSCYRSTIVPLEIILMIRKRISQGQTLQHFDQAFNITPCTSLYCHSLLADTWFEQCIDVMSTAEQESYKRGPYMSFSTRASPTFYCITKTEYGLKMWVLKNYPPHDGRPHYYQQRLFQDPLTKSQDFIPVCCYVTPSPYRVHVVSGNLDGYSVANLSDDDIVRLRKQFQRIERWFDKSIYDKSLYYGYDVDMNTCWIYPWTRCALPGIPLLLRFPYMEWTQIIYDTYCLYRHANVV